MTEARWERGDGGGKQAKTPLHSLYELGATPFIQASGSWKWYSTSPASHGEGFCPGTSQIRAYGGSTHVGEGKAALTLTGKSLEHVGARLDTQRS